MFLVSIGLGIWGYYGYAGQEALMKSVGDALAEVNATHTQLGAAMSSLNALLATKPGDGMWLDPQERVKIW